MRTGPSSSGAGRRFRVAWAVLALLPACEADPLSPFVGDDTPGAILVDFDTRPERWPLDAYRLEAIEIRGDTLAASLTHGGGCALHRYALVAWNGWLETAPVRVGVLLAHDDADDACDALLQPDLRFDLRPLREAYEKAYGRGPSTLILEITDPAQPSGPALASLSWQF